MTRWGRWARRASLGWVTVALGILLAAGNPIAAAAEDDLAAPAGAVPHVLQLVPLHGAPRMVTAWERDGALFVSVDAAAQLTGATEFWRSELGRMTLVAGQHEIQVTVGSDIAGVDGARWIHLPGPVFFWNGEVFLPLSLLVDDAGKAREWVPAPVIYSAERRRLSASRQHGVVTGASLEKDPAGWKLVVTADRPIAFAVTRAERASFVMRLRGVSYDPLLYPLPTEHPWFRGLLLRNLPDALEISFSPGAEAVGYRVSKPKGNRIEIFLGLDERDLREGTLRAFSSPPAARGRILTLVALDPGHGGSDPGAALGNDTEADLAYELCRRVAERLQRDLGVEVVWTHEPDADPSDDARAAAGARSHADVFLSVHLHDRPGGPAAFVAAVRRTPVPPPPDLAALGFRTLAGGQIPYLGESRLLARMLTDAVATNLGREAAGVFAEDLSILQAATMPAVLLELGRGDAPRAKWTAEELDEAAQGIVEGLRLYVLSSEDMR